jgi:hypothetical protein
LGDRADPQTAGRNAGAVLQFPTPLKPVVSFNRQELSLILNLYGSHVAGGDWRDYAMDFSQDKAVFSIFRRAAEVPLYRIVKEPALARKQGAYCVIAQGGLILKRGHDLAPVLRVLAQKISLAGA